jgi:hypothetical protein
MKSPIVLGMTLVFLFVIILCVATMSVLYWKNLAKVAKTQQIACPLNKFCPVGSTNDGSFATVRVIFPSDYDELTDGELLTFPYYDNFTTPTKKDLVVAIDTSSSVPGTSSTQYMSISNVGYSDYGASSPNITVYVAGLSALNDVSSVLPALFLKALRQSTSPVKKLAFMGISVGTSNGTDHLQYGINTFGISENISDLNVSSDSSSSTTLTGVDSLDFTPTSGTNPPGLTDVYANMNFINKYIAAPSFLGTGPSRCVEPSFNSQTCEGRTYNPSTGIWELSSSNINVVSANILDAWADFPNDQALPDVHFCSFNLDQTVNNAGPTGGVNGGGTSGPGFGGYQTNKFGTTLTDGGSGSFMKPGTPAPGSSASGAKPYTNPLETGDSSTVGTTAQSQPYLQTSVFCGGATQGSGNNLGATPTSSSALPYAAIYPNQDTKSSNYTNLGWPST